MYFAPEEVHAAIVTCGGLCPGINDVIRSIVGTLEEGYGVSKISEHSIRVQRVFGRMVSKIWSYRRKWLKKRTSKEGVS